MADYSKLTLEEYRERLDLCMNCGSCYARGPIVPHNWRELPPPEWSSPLKKCPSFEYYKYRSHTGYGRRTLAALVFQNRIPITDDLINIAYSCTSCGICNEICPTFQPLHAILALRQEIVEKRSPLPDPIVKILEKIETDHNIFGAKQRAHPIEGLPQEGEDIYFTGCYTSYIQPEIAHATVSVLTAAGINTAHLGERESCCGEFAKQAGNIGLFKELAQLNVEAMKKAGARRVILSCAHGYRTWKMDYPNVVGDLPFEIIHVTDLFSKLIEEGKIRFKKEMNKKVTYHDPCFLGRFGSRDYDSPRNVLKSIPGVELQEMDRFGRWSYCCGAGGKIPLNGFPDFANAIGRERLLEAKDAAAHLVTACPVCHHHMQRTANKEGIDIYIHDFSVFAAEALGLFPRLHDDLNH